MVHRIRASDPYQLNKGYSSNFCVGSRVLQEKLEEGWKTYWPKHCEYNYKDEGSCPKTLNDKTHQALLYFGLRPSPKMLFQGDAPKGSDTFQWPVIERDRVGGLRLIIWDKVKVPLCHYRVMHRKRVTFELHDSYFRLMTIKHMISKIEWALNHYITQLSSSGSWVEDRTELEWRCGKESHTQPKGSSGSPDELGSREDADKMQ